MSEKMTTRHPFRKSKYAVVLCLIIQQSPMVYNTIRRATPLEDEMELAAEGTPQQAAEAAELRETLQQALDALTEEHRQIFLLRQMRQLSYDEIGQLLGLESGTVKSRLNRAKKQLRQILLQQGNFFPTSSVLPKGEEDDHVL